MSNTVVFCEATNRPIDYVPDGTTEVPDRLREYGGKLIILDADEAFKRQEDAAKTPVQEISKRQWWYYLEVLPPVAWHNTADGESFKLSEREVGFVTLICVKQNGRYFQFHDDIRLPHRECCRRVHEAVEHGVKWAHEGNPNWSENKPEPGWGRIWWTFDSDQELEEWREKVGDNRYERGRSLRVLSIDRNVDSPRLHVVFEVEKAKANEILGYAVGDEEWLED